MEKLLDLSFTASESTLVKRRLVAILQVINFPSPILLASACIKKVAVSLAYSFWSVLQPNRKVRVHRHGLYIRKDMLTVQAHGEINDEIGVHCVWFILQRLCPLAKQIHEHLVVGLVRMPLITFAGIDWRVCSEPAQLHRRNGPWGH